MTQEDKDLLFKVLCARLPYGVKIYTAILPEKPVRLNSSHLNLIGDIKILPYLRPMSSMTRKEKAYWNYHRRMVGDGICSLGYDNPTFCIFECFEWLNSHHFDYGGLIVKGLALEAPEGMYKVD